MPVMHGVVQSPFRRASGCPRTLIGCTTARAAACRWRSAGTATAAIATAPANVRRIADVNRGAAPHGATSAAIGGRVGTPHVSAPGGIGKLKKW